MTVRFGTNPIAWSNDDLRDLGKETSLATCLTEARAAGFSGIELGHKFPRQSEALRLVLQHHGLSLISGWYSCELLIRSVKDEISAIQPHLQLLKEMGCNVLIVAETSNAIHGNITVPLSQRPVITAAEIKSWSQKLNELGSYIAQQGLRMAYHHHMGTIIQSDSDIRQMMDAAGSDFYLLLDTGHATFGGSDPVALAKDFKDRIAHIHCKDVRRPVMEEAKAKDWSFLQAVVQGIFTVPGDGMVDFPSVFQALQPTKYNGWLVVEAEQDPKKANPFEYAKLGYNNLHLFAKNAGMI